MLRPFSVNTTPLFNPGRTLRVDAHKFWHDRVKNKYHVGYTLEASVPENPLVAKIELSKSDMFGLVWWFVKSLLVEVK